MLRKQLTPIFFLIAIIFITGLACTAPFQKQGAPPQPLPLATPITVQETLPPAPPAATNTPTITHVSVPPSSVGVNTFIYDVDSSGTAPEKRAPYGDSYDIFRVERPFTQDMTYISDMDIVTFNVSLTTDWIFVSIELVSNNPNNEKGINYGVEMDTDGDGFGDFIIWANPPYKTEWSTDGVQVYKDTNHDTGGLSAEKSDAPLPGDGYDKLIFDAGVGDDPDLAWVRMNAGQYATIQFAFKDTIAGRSFLLGVLSDAGLKDVTRMYYNDRFTEEEAGSPEKSEKYYPIKEVYAFDNTCRGVFNYKSNGYEPFLCPKEPPPEREPSGKTPPPPGTCQPPTGGCPSGWWWLPDPDCRCETLY